MVASRGSWVFASALTCCLVGLAGAQKQHDPLPPAKDMPAVQPGGLPEGAVARLGETRLRHAEPPTCVAFSPDSKTFVTGGQDGSVRVWSVATGELVNITQKPAMGVAVLRFTHGGTKLAVHHGTESVIRFLDPKTLREVGSTPFINKHRFGFSTDGKMLLTNDAIGNAVVTEVESDLPKLELAGADRFDFRPDGKAVAVGDKGTVTVHLVTGGKPTFALKELGTVHGLAYSADGKRLAVGARSPEGNDTVRVYEDKNEKPVAEIAGMNLPRMWIDSDTIAVGNGTDVGVYDLKKKDWVGRVRGARGEFAVSPDGTKLVATGTGGLRVRLWDFASGKQMHAENDSFPDPSLMVGSADGKSLFLLATDTAVLWPIGAESAKTVGTLPGLAVSAAVGNGKLVVATAEAVIVYADFDPRKPLPARPTSTFAKSDGAKVVAVSPDGKRVAWAIEGGKVTVADAADKKPRAELPITTTTVMAIAFNPTGDGLAVIGRDTFLRLWGLNDKDAEVKELWKARVGRGQRAAIAFSPDGKYVVSASLAQVPVFNTADGTEVFKVDRYSDDGYAQHAIFSPDSRLLIFGSSGTSGRVEVWEMATRGLVRKFTTGYGGISRLCIFPDGKRLASAGAEEAVTVWDLTSRSEKSVPKADELLIAWTGLESREASVGYPAIKLLASAGDRGTDTISRGTKEVLVTHRKIKEWVEDLSSETFTIREVASKELLSLGIRAMPAVAAATRSEDPEVRDRALAVLRKMEAKGLATPAHGLTGDTLRLVRAVQALEEIGTARAKSLLGEIATAGGAPGDEAKAALSRFKKK